MSETMAPPRRILRAEEARHLPVWRPQPFPSDSLQAGARRRPQTAEEKLAIQRALLAAQQEAERREREAAAAAAADAARAAAAQPEPASEAPVQAPAEPLAPAVDPAEIERIKTAAFDEGYAAGYDHGTAAARKEADRLQAIAQSASEVFARFEHELAPRLVTLAVDIARQVVKHELSVDNTVVLAVVRDAFNQLVGGETGKQLLLHPSDVQLVRAHLGEELELGQWKILEDAGIEAGGCRVVTHQSDIDATLPTRWKRTLAALGQDAPWSGHDA
ncbi:flagellar assembly protein FliH [Pigmentiphaga sp.]|uniref:flagellar assembly protein FliH n=1 Tax=Pigmentiphaga sp. TaxID=1977564 RepID=UPI0025F5D799|nr:flagellar assembly protein FliH [Pigmentiphaga sp.]MBX6317760.1 flagellar assembly protein FliH [Pigmentiphaga sp.]